MTEGSLRGDLQLSRAMNKAKKNTLNAKTSVLLDVTSGLDVETDIDVGMPCHDNKLVTVGYGI